jgi:hypothetical protein
MAQLHLGLGQEDAIKMYYNASFAPWFSAAIGYTYCREGSYATAIDSL